jgi:hypothetical protein
MQPATNNRKQPPQQGSRGWLQTYLDVLAAVCGRGIKHYTKTFSTPREWIEFQVGGRCVRPEPRQPIGGQSYAQIERGRSIRKKAQLRK